MPCSGKRLLLLGGSAQQVCAIERAKALGCHTILIDMLPDNPGRHVAHKWYPLSTTDIDAVLHTARTERVDGILPYSSDPAAWPAATVCEQLGLPSIPAEAARTLSLKHLFRSLQRSLHLPHPPFITVSADNTSPDTSALPYPLIVKPTDSSGSKGVSIVPRPDRLAEAIRRAAAFSRNRLLIIEQYTPFTRIIGGDIIMQRGKIVINGLNSEIRCPQAPLVPAGKIFNPADDHSHIASRIERILTHLGIRDGQFNNDIGILPDGTFQIIEIGPRAGGNLEPLFLSAITGTDLLEYNILNALGQAPDLHSVYPREKYPFVKYIIHSHRGGTLDSIHYSPDILPYIFHRQIYLHPGDTVHPFANARHAIGILLLRFPSCDIMQRFLPRMHHHIRPGLQGE